MALVKSSGPEADKEAYCDRLPTCSRICLLAGLEMRKTAKSREGYKAATNL
jgi:hypothetical protein